MSTSGKANSRQVAGTHYNNHGFPHWDLAAEYALGYFEGNISKYITRHTKKNGLEDVEKALHYLEKLLEQEKKPAPWYAPWRRTHRQGRRVPWPVLQRYFSANQVDENEEIALAYLFNWNDREDLLVAYRAILRIKHRYEVKAHKETGAPVDEFPIPGMHAEELEETELEEFADTQVEFAETQPMYRTLDDPPRSLKYNFSAAQPPHSGGEGEPGPGYVNQDR